MVGVGCSGLQWAVTVERAVEAAVRPVGVHSVALDLQYMIEAAKDGRGGGAGGEKVGVTESLMTCKGFSISGRGRKG